MEDRREAEAFGDLLFYDGQCGLCHGLVRFVLRRAPRGEALRFAPLQGETFRSVLARIPAQALPDSMVVQDREGRLLVRTAAVIHVLQSLGGPWAVLGRWIGWVPRPWRDGVYNGVARVRRRLFRRPEGLCPRLPPEARRRFLP